MPESPAKQFSGIFVSYRRDDSSGHAGRLFDKLLIHFGEDQIFMDIDTIEPGEDFVQVIEDAVGSCEILIALIGKRWLSSTDGTSRRLDNPNDFVRLEISAALNRDVRVIPVLVEGARMPRQQDLPDDLARLVRRHALEISDLRWHHDIAQLINVIEKVLAKRAEARRIAAEEEEERQRREAETRKLEAEPKREYKLRKRLENEEAGRGEAERRRQAEAERQKREAEEARQLAAELQKAVEKEKARATEAARRQAEDLRRREAEEATRRLAAERERRTKAPPPEFVSRHLKAASIGETVDGDLPAQIHATGTKRRSLVLVAGAVGLLIVGAIGLWLGLGTMTKSSTSNGEQSFGQQNVAPANNSGGAPTSITTQSTSPTNANNEAPSPTSANRNSEKRSASTKPPRTATPAQKRPQGSGAAERQKKALDALRNPKP